MNKNCHIALLLFWILPFNLFSQPDSALTYKQGLYITSKGTIKALAVFIQFKDDNDNPQSEHWKPNQPPAFLNTYLDSSLDQVSAPWSFSGYYREMSNDSLRIYGKGYFAVAQHNQDYYRKATKRISSRDTLRYDNDAFGLAAKEVLSELNSQIDYSEYDNWTFGNNKHEKRPDRKVDLIIVLFRTNTWPPNLSGIATLANGGVSDTTLDGTEINFGFVGGSGITNSGGSHGMAETLRSMKHEFGHRLLGGGHPSIVNTGSGGSETYSGMWGIMPIRGYCANAFEREKLGWITPTVITENTQIQLTDYVTTGMALKIPIPGTNNFYYVENHLQQSLYDSEVDQVNGKGLFIYKVVGRSNHPAYDVEVAEGKYNWSNYWASIPGYLNGDSIPVYTKLDKNRKGYDLRDWIPHEKSLAGGKFLVYVMDEDGAGGKPYYTFNGWRGNGNTSFKMNYNRVFAPWTNPGSGNDKNISVSILEDTGEQMTVKIYVDDIVITEDTTIPAEKFEFTGNLIVPDGITLTIEKGAELIFSEGKSLIVHGKKIKK